MADEKPPPQAPPEPSASLHIKGIGDALVFFDVDQLGKFMLSMMGLSSAELLDVVARRARQDAGRDIQDELRAKLVQITQLKAPAKKP